MSLTNLHAFPIEKFSLSIVPLSLLIVGLLNFLGICITLYCGSKFLSGLQSFLRHHLILLKGSKQGAKKKSSQDSELRCSLQRSVSEKIDDEKICSAEVEIVMGRLGIFCHPEGAKLRGRLGCEDLYKLFEDKEPNYEEIKETFDVFDYNNDGFIDAKELQRILCALGLKEGSDIANCTRMIKAFDDDSDGRIDFPEFLKFMENSFC